MVFSLYFSPHNHILPDDFTFSRAQLLLDSYLRLSEMVIDTSSHSLQQRETSSSTHCGDLAVISCLFAFADQMSRRVQKDPAIV